jgi:hypothetical protein
VDKDTSIKEDLLVILSTPASRAKNKKHELVGPADARVPLLVYAYDESASCRHVALVGVNMPAEGRVATREPRLGRTPCA